MLSAIAGVVNAIGKGLKRAEKRIDKVIKKTKVKLQQAESADDKLQTSVQKGKRLGGIATKWQLKATRLWLKLLEWFLYFLDLLIKLIILLCSSVMGLLIIVAVILIVFIGTLLQQMGSVNDTDFGGISIGEGGTVDVGGLDWDALVKQAEAKAKTGEFNNLDLNRIRAFAITYELYNQSEKDWLPWGVLGITITESGFQFWDIDGKPSCPPADYNLYTDNMYYPQQYGSLPYAHGVFQIEYVSNALWEDGKRDGSDFYWGKYTSPPTGHPELVDLTTSSRERDYPIARTYSQSYFPFALKRTVDCMRDFPIKGDESRFGMGDIYSDVVKAVGLEENEETEIALSSSMYKCKHWCGGLAVKPNTTNAFIVCAALYAKAEGDWSAYHQGDSAEDIDFTIHDNMYHATDRICSGDSFVFKGKPINKNIFAWLKDEYKGNATVCNAVDGLVNFGITVYGDPQHYIGGGIFDTYIMYQTMLDYLGELGVTQQMFESAGTATVTGGGSGAFGLEYYNSDGSVNIEALNTASAILGEFCKYENAYVDTITLPSEVSIKDKDGKDKKVKIKGGTYPNFWGMKYNITAATGNWGQCTWFAKGRAMLWLYENVGTDESQWYLGGSSKPMGGNGVAVASSMSGWCTVDSTLGSNSVVSRSGDAYYNKYTGTYYRPGHVAYIEAVDTKNNMYYVSHGNISRCSYQQIRFSGGADNWGNMPDIKSVVGDIDSGRGFSYIQEIPIVEAGGGGVVSDAGGYPFVDIAHLDKRK